MKPNRLMVMASITASVVALLGSTALAQGGAGAGGQAAAPAVPASGMGMGPGGMGPGMGPGMRSGRGPYGQWGTDYTPGWSLMTRAERNEHRARMRSMKTYEECKAYIDQHHEQMAARAKEKGGKPLVQPRRDACVRLKP